jgi:hypothetical protein
VILIEKKAKGELVVATIGWQKDSGAGENHHECRFEEGAEYRDQRPY